MALRVLSIVGARPQFVKAAMVVESVRAYNRAAKPGHRLHHSLLHTGQHYDRQLSDVFFEQMPLPRPKYNLGIGSGTHGAQTGKQLAAVEEVLLKQRPDVVVVYGDTNSTLAGALAASKLGIKVAHIEAGLRSFNRGMPEEINRVLTDHLADVLFCPTATAVQHLADEGVRRGVYFSGDVMLDAVLMFHKIANRRSRVLAELDLTPGQYILLTLHRAENTDSQRRLAEVLELLTNIPHRVVFPMHPRTRNRIVGFPSLRGLLSSLAKMPNVLQIDPVSYLDMLTLEGHARIVMTDSGGVQKEAYFLGVPCLTLRKETEWTETLEGGWNRLTDPKATQAGPMLDGLWNRNGQSPSAPRDLSQFGSGRAAVKLVHQLIDFMSQAGHSTCRK